MISFDKNLIINEVKQVCDSIVHSAELSQSDSLLQHYSDDEYFVAFGGDGRMRKYKEYKELCEKFYTAVSRQEFITLQESYNVIDSNLVIRSWMGNINAFFKNGDTMIMKDYGITAVFRRTGDGWKVIQSHESSLPPEIKKGK